MTRKIVATTLFAVVVCGCAPDPGYVKAEVYGERWPLTVPDGTLRCRLEGPRKPVTFVVNGNEYGVNGAAKTLGHPDVSAIMKPGLVGVHLQPLIDAGLALCPP